MNIKGPTNKIGFTPSTQDFKNSIEVGFNFWIINCENNGSWRNVYQSNFPEEDVGKTIEFWKTHKLDCLDIKPPFRQKANEIVYSKVIEPELNNFLILLDKLLSSEKEKACTFGSWLFTNAISKLDLVGKNTSLERELNKRFEKIEIAPRLKHCCIGLCSACGRKGIVYACSNPRI